MGYVRKYLSADGLCKTVYESIKREHLPVCAGSEYSWHDCIMSELAIFGLKFSSLLKFETAKANEPRIRHNLLSLYKVQKAPSDTCLRERLDKISPSQLRRPFKAIFASLQRGNMLEKYRYLDGHYIVSIDGTGQYSSNCVHCDNCCQKHHRNGEITYYHSMLGAVVVHPDYKTVLPLAPEPIVKADGAAKNDCERNAAARLLKSLRREHPYLKVLLVEDGLAANHPHLTLLNTLNMSYVIGARPGDHKYLFAWVKYLAHESHIEVFKGVKHEFHYYNQVPLNEQHHDYKVNLLIYSETTSAGKEQHFSWVTNFTLTSANVYAIMRAGRARWRIENETFNTLKNQGYNFEHNYGHGYKNLCSIMSMLMLLAFLIDQTQQLCCKTYQTARKHTGAFRVLWENIRTLITYALWASFSQLLEYIGNPNNRAPPEQHFR